MHLPICENFKRSKRTIRCFFLLYINFIFPKLGDGIRLAPITFHFIPRIHVWSLLLILNICENLVLYIFSEGHWAILQNIHLVKNWLPSLEKKIEEYSEGSHINYRIFLSAEPAPNPEQHIIPQRFFFNCCLHFTIVMYRNVF